MSLDNLSIVSTELIEELSISSEFPIETLLPVCFLSSSLSSYFFYFYSHSFWR